LGKSAYGGGVVVCLFLERRCSPDYFFCNVIKNGGLDNNKKIKETMFIVNNRQLLLRYEIKK
jgi:hypothetical protein